jgi:tetratricopeptide (TPR) repeat protein
MRNGTRQFCSLVENNRRASVGARLRCLVILAGLIGAGDVAFADDPQDCRDTSGDAAIAACTRAIESGRLTNQDLAVAFFNRGNAYGDRKGFDRAIPEYSEAIRIDPRSAGSVSTHGHAYSTKDFLLQGESGQIRSKLKAANAYLARGLTYYAKVKMNEKPSYSDEINYEHAIADFDKSVDIGLDAADAYYYTGVVRSSKGDSNAWQYFGFAVEQDVADYSEAITLDAKNAATFNNRGAAFAEMGEYDRAIADLNEAIRLTPTAAAAFYNRGLAYHARRSSEDDKRAAADLSEVIRLKPQFADAFYERATLYQSKGDYDSAIADYSEAIRINPKDVRALLNRGCAYRGKGDNDSAMADFAEADKARAESEPRESWLQFCEPR